MLSKILLSLLLLSVIVTSGIAYKKITEEPTIIPDSSNSQFVNTPTETQAPSLRPTVKPFPTLTKVIPTVFINQTGNLCLVTISGQRYDVTRLASTHSGGNIFICGADMTTSYNSKHGSNLSRMTQYLYTGTGTSIIGTPAITGTNRRRDDDDD
jgi:cytochrome b involved in lipid metabolism